MTGGTSTSHSTFYIRKSPNSTRLAAGVPRLGVCPDALGAGGSYLVGGLSPPSQKVNPPRECVARHLPLF